MLFLHVTQHRCSFLTPVATRYSMKGILFTLFLRQCDMCVLSNASQMNEFQLFSAFEMSISATLLDWMWYRFHVLEVFLLSCKLAQRFHWVVHRFSIGSVNEFSIAILDDWTWKWWFFWRDGNSSGNRVSDGIWFSEFRLEWINFLAFAIIQILFSVENKLDSLLWMRFQFYRLELLICSSHFSSINRTTISLIQH